MDHNQHSYNPVTSFALFAITFLGSIFTSITIHGMQVAATFIGFAITAVAGIYTIRRQHYDIKKTKMELENLHKSKNKEQ